MSISATPKLQNQLVLVGLWVSITMERETPRGQISTRKVLRTAAAVGLVFGAGTVIKQQLEADSGGQSGPKPDGPPVHPEKVGLGVDPDPEDEPFSLLINTTEAEDGSLLNTIAEGDISGGNSLELALAGHHQAVWEPKASGQFRISSVVDDSSGAVEFRVPGGSEVIATIQETLLVRPLTGQADSVMLSTQRVGARTEEFTISEVGLETIKGAIVGAISGATNPAFGGVAKDIVDLLTDGVQVASGSSIEDSFETDAQSHRLLQKTVDLSAGRTYVFDFFPTFYFKAAVESSIDFWFRGELDYASQEFRVNRVG